MNYCDTCIHREVCGEEDARDSAVTFCAERIEHCEDCISRAKLIQKLEAWDHNVNAIPNYVWKVIREAPPVIPQYTEAEIQKMQEMEQAEIQKAYELGKAEMQLSEDCISRQAVLDATVNKNSIWNKITNSKGENLEEIISQLPPVNSQDPKTDVLDKIRAEIQSLRNCSCSCSDGIIDDVEDIIDKYKASPTGAESEG